jgi:hypothetical protein
MSLRRVTDSPRALARRFSEELKAEHFRMGGGFEKEGSV